MCTYGLILELLVLHVFKLFTVTVMVIDILVAIAFVIAILLCSYFVLFGGIVGICIVCLLRVVICSLRFRAVGFRISGSKGGVRV